jgi:hypothetical protein
LASGELPIGRVPASPARSRAGRAGIPEALALAQQTSKLLKNVSSGVLARSDLQRTRRVRLRSSRRCGLAGNVFEQLG